MRMPNIENRHSRAVPSSSKPKKPGVQTIFWWILWIVLTIGSFFVAAAFWTPIIAQKFGSVRETKASIYWVVSVFGSWMILLVPLIVFMYSKVDKAYEDARIRREQNALRFRSINIDQSKRMLPSGLCRSLQNSPETIQGGHLVTALLKDGRRIPNVFIANRSEVLGVYDVHEMPFEISEIQSLELIDLEKIPAFLTTSWLRLDGTQPQV